MLCNACHYQSKDKHVKQLKECAHSQRCAQMCYTWLPITERQEVGAYH